MERLLVAALLVAVAVVAAVLLGRRRPVAPVRTSWTVPTHLDRTDFAWPDAPWLLAVFSSATCESCRSTWALAQRLSRDDVAAVEVEARRDRVLHERYGIDAVPLVVVADRDGVVRASFVGPPGPDELATALTELIGS